jgi:hypothetical protein
MIPGRTPCANERLPPDASMAALLALSRLEAPEPIPATPPSAAPTHDVSSPATQDGRSAADDVNPVTVDTVAEVVASKPNTPTSARAPTPVAAEATAATVPTTCNSPLQCFLIAPAASLTASTNGFGLPRGQYSAPSSLHRSAARFWSCFVAALHAELPGWVPQILTSPKGSFAFTGSSPVYAYGCPVSATSGSTVRNCPEAGS